jgi:hypothetical protein
MGKRQILLIAGCVTAGLVGGVLLERILNGTDDSRKADLAQPILKASITAGNVKEELSRLLENPPSGRPASKSFTSRCVDFAARLGPDAFPAAAQAALAQSEPRQREMLTPLAERWVRVDLDRAKQFALEQTGPGRRPMLSALFNSWLRYSRVSLETWLEQTTDVDVIEIGVPILVSTLSRGDPARAHDFWKKLPPDQQRHWGWQMFSRWEESDPAAVVTNLAPSATSDPFLLGVLKRAAQSWAKKDATAAAGYVNALPEGNRRRELIGEVTSVLGQSEPLLGLQLVQSLPPGESRQTLLRSLVTAWATENAVAAFAWAREQPEGVERRVALDASLDKLGEANPQALQQFVLQEPAHPAVVGRAAVLARHFMGTNAAGLLEWARRLPPGGTRDSVLSQGLAGVNGLAPGDAVLLVREQLTGYPRRSALQEIFRRWVERDPKAASAAAVQIPLGADREAVWDTVVTVWVKTSPEAASAWLLSLEETPDRHRAEATLVRTIQEKTPADAANLVAKLKPSIHSAEIMEATLTHWARVDLNAAANWLSGQPDDIRRRQAFGKLAEMAIKTDLSRAAEFALNSPVGDNHGNARGKVASAWANTDPEGATKWVVAHATNDLQLKHSFPQVFALWSRLSPEEAAQYLATLPANAPCFTRPASQLECLQVAVSYWAGKDPAAAMKWVEAKATGEGRRMVERDVLNRWAKHDPNGLLRWLQTLPADNERDRLAAPALQTLASMNPELAAHNVALISSQPERQSVMQTVFGVWHRLDADSAKAWLQTNSLPESTKKSLQRLYD